MFLSAVIVVSLWCIIVNSLKEKWSRLKESDISRNNIPLKLWTKATISFMEARVIEKTTLKRLGREFIFTWSKIMGKTSTSKDIERNMVEVLLRVQNRIWGLLASRTLIN